MPCLNLTLKSVAFLIIAPTIILAEVLLDVDFDNHPLGQYTAEMGSADFHYPGYTWQHGMNEGRGEIVAGRTENSRALRMLYPAGTFGANAQAVQIRAALANKVDTAHASYWVMFEEGFDFARGGKLPGLCGNRCITGGNDANGYNGWSARIMWRGGGVATQYMYYVTNEGFGEDLVFDESPPAKRFVPGVWHRVNTQIIMNTPQIADGVIRSWFDGELAMERTNILIRNIDTLKIDLFYISTFFGGSDMTWAPSRDTYITFDDFLVVSNDASVTSPQVLYNLSQTSGRVPFTITADLSASLAPAQTVLEYDVEFPGGVSQTRNGTQVSWTYSSPGIYSVRPKVRGGAVTSIAAPRKVFALGERDLLLDSAWLTTQLADTIRNGDTLRAYLTIVDPAARILMGPAISSEAIVGESTYFGILLYDNGVFSATSGSGNFIDGMTGGAGTYEIIFVCTFGNPGTYSVSVREILPDGENGLQHTWNDLARRGYSLFSAALNTFSTRGQAGVIHFEPFAPIDDSDDGTSVSHARPPRANSRNAITAVSRGNGIVFNFNDARVFEIEIFDARGRRVRHVPASMIAGERSAFARVPASGVYLYRVKSGTGQNANVSRGSVVVR